MEPENEMMDEEKTENVEENVDGSLNTNDASINTKNLESNEADMTLSPPDSGEFIAKGSKKLIKLLLQRKVILLGIVGLALIVILAIFLGGNISSEVMDYRYMESVKDTCEEVEIIYRPYGSDEETTKTMKLEDYIDAATYAYTKDFKEQDDSTYHVYKSLAIALRTEVVANGCKITYRDKNITKKPTSGDNMSVLDSALKNSRGIVLSKQGRSKILAAHVSDFCYSLNDGENYTIFQVANFKIPTSWVTANVLGVYRDCPCNQPTSDLPSCFTNGTTDGEWMHQDDASGYNVYGALYLLEEYGMNAESILKYFFGNVDYWTIEKEEKEEDEEKQLCGAMDLHSTTLSKAQFVQALENYNGDSSIYMELFKANAGMIYDVGVENNLNPEFIVARAVSEGFSPGTDNNFWGWNCTNTGGGLDCRHFSSDFRQAVIEYANLVVNQYTDMEDLLMRYAQLGTYWYNPGNWSLGGCAYKDSVFPDEVPARVADACSPNNYCDSAGNGYCVPVLKEEQYLYGQWQMRKMMATRKAIWGLEEYDCNVQASGAGCMWWPIGSSSTTVENGEVFAKGSPETTTITSGFGGRNDPTGNSGNYHPAIDIGGGREGGTNIIATADGVVTDIYTGCIAGDTFCGGRLGNAVYLKHSDGSTSRYGHLYEVKVNVGDQVKQGQVIGLMGNTGDSTGPHLDFQVVVNGEKVNPLNYVSSSDARKKCSGDGSVVTGNSNAQTICLTLKQNGYSDDAIEGIMGNLKRETTQLDPNVVNSSYCSGIAQWCGNRNESLRSTYGSSWNRLDNQLKFMLNELNSGYKNVDNYLRENHTISEYADYFCNYFEIPGADICANGLNGIYGNDFHSFIRNGCR